MTRAGNRLARMLTHRKMTTHRDRNLLLGNAVMARALGLQITEKRALAHLHNQGRPPVLVERIRVGEAMTSSLRSAKTNQL